MAALKRPRDDGAPVKSTTKRHKGFVVGPDNLPDGSYKRKVQKIKKDLIHKAKLKKEYSKLKQQELNHVNTNDSAGIPGEQPLASASSSSGPVPVLHPERQRMLEGEYPEPESADRHTRPPRQRGPRPQPFAQEEAQGRWKKQQAEAALQARQEAAKQRQEKLAERERFRKAMAKARGSGPNGQRKLGRESQVLLARVKKMVGN